MSLTATLWDVEDTSKPVGTVTVVDGKLVTTGDISPRLFEHVWDTTTGDELTPADGDRYVSEWAKRFGLYSFVTVE